MAERRPGSRSRRSRHVMAALALSAVALAACNLLTGLDAEYSASGRDGSTSGDSGGLDGAAPDRPSGDGSNDGQTTQDTGTADGTTSTWCRALQDGSADDDFFCTDFESNDVTAAWSGVKNTVTGGAGTFALLTDAGLDGSQVLDVVSDSTSAAKRDTRLFRTFNSVAAPESYRSYDVRFRFRLVTSALDYDAFGLLIFGGNGTQKENGIAGYSAGANHVISREAPYGTSPLITNDLEWHNVHIRLEHASAGATFNRTISLDGTDLQSAAPGYALEGGAPTELWLGIFNTSATAGRSHAQFDDVVVRRERF